MPWKLIVLWIALGTVAAPIAGALFGSVVGIVNSDSTENFLVVALTGALATFGYSVGLALLGLPFVSVSVLSWVCLVRRVPKLDVSFINVVAYSALLVLLMLGVLAFLGPEFDFQFAFLLAVLLFSAIVAPRLVAEALRPGAFVA